MAQAPRVRTTDLERSMNRRSFSGITAGSVMAAPWIGRLACATAEDKRFDPSFGTATQATRAIRTGVISSRELVQTTFRRIKKYNRKINAFITLIEEQAMRRAREADDDLAKGNIWGRLHGLPILVKDTFATAGVRTTYGSKDFERFVPTEDAVAVARLKRAGAIIVGKTSTPPYGGDHQTFNELVGTTNNPWDPRGLPGVLRGVVRRPSLRASASSISAATWGDRSEAPPISAASLATRRRWASYLAPGRRPGRSIVCGSSARWRGVRRISGSSSS